MKLIVNCETNETTEVELTEAEIADREESAAAAALDAQLLQQKINEKNAVLTKLGLTDEEVAAFLS